MLSTVKSNKEMELAIDQYNHGIYCCQMMDNMTGYNWFLKSAKQGYAEAQYIMGLWYEIPKSFYDAFVWYKAAANQGHAAAQYQLGLLYYYGKGVENNYKEAVKWIKKAAEQNNPEARFFLLNQ